ncbi:hypothetical protein CVT24_004578 [Panaeolus cyanescens]|uniref:Fungal lipase-type domain-containing protein n=1 Tax=Panaeolus cyanescens TaxID=181874 RepID=A0A409VA39_9AGAR|nr:hypothetical protein CVT24_004578 [Panaeolus cyanescens]
MTRFFSFALPVLLLSTAWGAAAAPALESRQSGISQSVYDNLVRYTKYSSAVYQWICPRPLGNTLVDQFAKAGTDGLIARDDSRKEIVVVFRGTSELADIVVDINLLFKTLSSTGLTGIKNEKVHSGFQFAYNVVADTVLKTVRSESAKYPSYRIVVTGHSLGGAVASIAALSIKAALPSVPLQLYTFGQPRVGNAEFATYVENRIGTANIFRAVHTYDGVPTILFKSLGYRHFGTEYWNFDDPASPSSVKKCTGGDDPTCSDSIPSTFINPAHIVYFNQAMALNPLLCI